MVDDVRNGVLLSHELRDVFETDFAFVMCPMVRHLCRCTSSYCFTDNSHTHSIINLASPSLKSTMRTSMPYIKVHA